jgi:hypothetical protein
MNHHQRVQESLTQVEQDVQTLQIQRSDLLAQLQTTDTNLTCMNDEHTLLVESMVIKEADMSDKVLCMIFTEA